MSRPIQLLAVAATAAGLVGCANTWERMSSRSFLDDPAKNLFAAEDPMTVLRTKVSPADRADAMRRLKEPAAHGRGADEQDECLQTLAAAATTDPSPVIRTAAIDALGRFQDPRVIPLLIAAYEKADGLSEKPAVLTGVQPAAAFKPTSDPLAAFLDNGFQPEFTGTIRVRALAALGNTQRAEAVEFLASVASGAGKSTDEMTVQDRDVRAAAIRGLGQVRTKESVEALAKVMSAEAGHDVILTRTAHEGLVELTGKQLPADPQQWNQVIQAGGATVAPPADPIQRAFGIK